MFKPMRSLWMFMRIFNYIMQTRWVVFRNGNGWSHWMSKMWTMKWSRALSEVPELTNIRFIWGKYNNQMFMYFIKLCVQCGLSAFAEQFGLTPEEFSENLTEYVKHDVRQVDKLPNEAAAEFVKELEILEINLNNIRNLESFHSSRRLKKSFRAPFICLPNSSVGNRQCAESFDRFSGNICSFQSIQQWREEMKLTRTIHFTEDIILKINLCRNWRMTNTSATLRLFVELVIIFNFIKN